MYKGIIKAINSCAILAFCVFATNSYAVSTGFYMGLMLGPATNSAGQVTVTASNASTIGKPSSKQFGVRGYLGYQFVQYVAVETGGTYYTVVNYEMNPKISGVNPRTGIATWDLVGVGILPLNWFSIFGKLGAAVVYQGTSRSIRPAPNKSRYTTTVKPTFGFGVGYDINQSWVADLSWNRITGVRYLNSVDFFAIGISYHIVDRFCGQFLCDD